MHSAYAIGFAVLAFAGCGLRLHVVDTSVSKPSNVVAYFAVTDARNRPLPNLAASQFRIYEDGELVSPFESKQTILNPEVAAAHYTLLLVDMSASVTDSGHLRSLVEAVSMFSERVGKTHELAVYAFDGGKEIHPIVDFASGAGSVRSGIAGLSSFQSKDPSTNLNGAVIEGLRTLQDQVARATKPLRFGTLVVFTDGSDHAHRVSRSTLMSELDKHEQSIDIFVIGIGGEINEGELGAIGRSGAVLSKEPAEVMKAFTKVAGTIEDYTRCFYLFSYCSPARAGRHQLRIVADVKDIGSGGITRTFDAAGFAPNCDPNSKPPFDVHHPRLYRRR